MKKIMKDWQKIIFYITLHTFHMSRILNRFNSCVTIYFFLNFYMSTQRKREREPVLQHSWILAGNIISMEFKIKPKSTQHMQMFVCVCWADLSMCQKHKRLIFFSLVMFVYISHILSVFSYLGIMTGPQQVAEKVNSPRGNWRDWLSLALH